MSDDTIKRLREAIAEHPLSPIHGYGADIAALLDRLNAAEREVERLRDLLARTLGGHRDLDLQDAIIAALDAARREK